MSNEIEKKKVKLIDVNSFNEHMKLVEEYSKYIERTISALLVENKELNKEDLKRCVKYSRKIRRYAYHTLKGEGLYARVAIKEDEDSSEKDSNEIEES